MSELEIVRNGGKIINKEGRKTDYINQEPANDVDFKKLKVNRS